MKRKSFVLALTAAMMAAALVVGGTLAYFTDTDQEINTFTVGNVDIELIESQYHRTNAGKGNATDLTEPLTGGYLWAANVDLQGTPNNTDAKDGTTGNHTYFSDKQIKDDAKTYKKDYFAEHSTNMVPGSNVRKNPYVVNTGKNDAYVRVNAYVPVKLFALLDKGPSMWTTTAMNEGKVVSKAVDAYNANTESFLDGNAKDYIVNYKGVDCYKFDFTYTYILQPGDMTFWNCWGNIAIDPAATDLSGIGENGFDVTFTADAIQATGFADYKAAFEAFDAQV